MSDPRSYADCATIAATRQRKLANNTYLETDQAPERYAVRLHATRVVTFHKDGAITLDSGGWRTLTTKERMNRFSPLRVWSDRGVWYVAAPGDGWGSESAVAFEDGITYSPKRGFEGAGDETATRKLRKQARNFARDYIEALMAGDVPAPGPGDCWGCLMVAGDGTAPMGGPGHIEEHMREAYYVPSMLMRAIRNPNAKDGGGEPATRGGSWVNDGEYVVSTAALHVLGYLWGHHEQRAEYWESTAAEQLRKALTAHLYRELGA